MSKHRYVDYSGVSKQQITVPQTEEIQNDVPVVEAGQAKELTETAEEVTASESGEKEEAKAPAQIQNAKGKVVNCEMVNVRTSANANCPIVSVIPRDEEVEITSMSNPDYYKVRTNLNLDGFIKRDFIEII